METKRKKMIIKLVKRGREKEKGVGESRNSDWGAKWGERGTRKKRERMRGIEQERESKKGQPAVYLWTGSVEA